MGAYAGMRHLIKITFNYSAVTYSAAVLCFFFPVSVLQIWDFVFLFIEEL